MSSARCVKCGVVGCGVIANDVYIPTVSKKAELVATCDVVAERAKGSMELWGGKEYYTNVDEMLKKADLEVVFVLTAMGTHAQIAAKAARAGKHVLIQKPFATTMRDAENGDKAIKKAGVKALVEPNVQMDPLYAKAKGILNEGTIGDIYWFRAGLGRGPPTWSRKTFFTKQAGGPLYDLGVYQVSVITFLLGPAVKVTGLARISIPEVSIVPDEVFTEGLSHKPYESFWKKLGSAPLSQKIKMEAEDNTFTLLHMKSGSLGCVIANFVTPEGLRKEIGNMPEVEIYGSKGAMFIGGPTPLSVLTKNRDSKYYAGDGWYHVPKDEVPEWNYYVGSTDHLLDCVVKDKAPLPSLDWGMHVSEIMIKSIHSSRTARTLKIASTFK